MPLDNELIIKYFTAASTEVLERLKTIKKIVINERPSKSKNKKKKSFTNNAKFKKKIEKPNKIGISQLTSFLLFLTYEITNKIIIKANKFTTKLENKENEFTKK
jgi:hypothetical protein